MDAAALVGQPYSTVRDRLTGLGLMPVRVDDGSNGASGDVSGVEPAGQVLPGSSVTVHVVPAAVAPAPAPVAPPPAAGDGRGGKGDNGKGGRRK